MVTAARDKARCNKVHATTMDVYSLHNLFITLYYWYCKHIVHLPLSTHYSPVSCVTSYFWQTYINLVELSMDVFWKNCPKTASVYKYIYKFVCTIFCIVLKHCKDLHFVKNLLCSKLLGPEISNKMKLQGLTNSNNYIQFINTRIQI